MKITVNNVVGIASRLMTVDPQQIRVQHREKFASEVGSLKDILREYQSLTRFNKPSGLSHIDWMEQTLQQMISLTQYCLAQLTDEGQRLIGATESRPDFRVSSL